MRSCTIFAFLMLAILGTIIVMSLGYPAKAKRFPLAIAIPVAALQVVLTIREVRVKAELRDNEVAGKDAFSNYVAVMVWIAGLLLTIYLVGLLVGFSLFTFIYLKLHRQSWLLSIILTVVMAAVVYGGFVLGFKMQLYTGLLFM